MNVALRLIHFLLRHRLATGLFILASVGASLFAARSIEVRFQYKDFYDYAGNPRLPLLTRYTDDFGDPGGYVVLLIEAPDVFSSEVLQYIDSATRQLEASDKFRKIRSLTNTRAIRASESAQPDEVGEVESGPVLPHLPTTPEEVERARRVALGSSLLVRRVVSPDSTATAILAEMVIPTSTATIPQQRAAVDVVRQLIRSTPAPAGARIQVSGAPLVEVETTRALIRDQSLLTPGVLLILITALALTFRSVHGILLPLASVLVSLAWTVGIFSFWGRPLDIVTSTFPTVLLVYGVVDPIFVYTRFLDKLPRSRTREEAVLAAMRELLLPCLLTSITTALGFGAFMTAELPMIKSFGLVVAVGVTFAFVTTVTVLPLLLVTVGPTQHNATKPKIALAAEAFLAWLWQTVRVRPELMLGVALSALILGGAAARGMTIVNEYVGTLPRGAVQDGVRVLEQKLSGVVRIGVYLEGDADSLKRPEVLKAIEAVDHFAEQQPIVSSSLALSDLVSDTNQAFVGGDPSEHRVPDSEFLISQYLSLVDPGDLSDFVTSDYSRGLIRILVADQGSSKVLKLVGALQENLDARLPQLGVKATVTGHGVVSYFDSDRVVLQMLWGFLAAFGVILIVQLTTFRSIRVALITIVPNLVPVGACFLVMRALGLHLRVDNSLVLCISIGGLFNTTIHMVTRVQQQVHEGDSGAEAIVERALASVGPPSLYTAAVLSVGFSAMGLSQFPGLRMLGLLCLVTLSVGFIADATITTTFLRLFFNWKQTRSPARPGSTSRRGLPIINKGSAR